MDKNEVIRTGAGSVIHMTNGRLHREDGPAMMGCDGIEKWYSIGRVHRSDGPAYCNPLTNEYRWFFQGTQYTFLEWTRILVKTPSEITALSIVYDNQTKGVKLGVVSG